MSYHLTLHSWSGSDPTASGEKLAKVFRLDPAEAIRIVQDIQAGQSWTFGHTIPDEQADLTVKYLHSLGFKIDLAPVLPPEIPAIKQSETASSMVEESSTDVITSDVFSFSGTGVGLFKIFIKNLIFTIGTLGIYRYWAKTNVRRYLWDHTIFRGDPFQYHGTGMELLRGSIRLVGLIILVSGGIGVGWYMELLDDEAIDFLISFLNIMFLVLLPAFMVGSRRYLLSRSSWRSIRFSFRGGRKDATIMYIKGWLLSIITLGYYWPYFLIEKETYWRNHSYFGDKKITFDGLGKDILKSYILMGILFFPTLGINLFWYHARLQSYFWSRTHFEGATFRFTATGKEWMMLGLGNLLLLICSFGLAFPWVTTRSMKFRMEHLYVEGNIDLDHVVQQMQDSGAFGDVMLDAMDVDMDIG
jgi:uncharacterized membrane protein YjgN (DUF898 family)